MKRRILEKLKLTEISGVDRPCQRGAVVTIMKRDVVPTTESLDARVAKLKQQVAGLTNNKPVEKFWSIAARLAAAAARRAGGKLSGRAALAATGRGAKHLGGKVGEHLVVGAATHAVVSAAEHRKKEKEKKKLSQLGKASRAVGDFHEQMNLLK